VRPSARRTSTTVVAVVGEHARACVERLDRGANVATLIPEAEAPVLDRAVEAWSAATRIHTPYFVHDADPLAAAAAGWVRRFDEQGPVGELEVAVSDTLARWRAGSIELPDYYLVLDAESWTPTRRHWYLGVLHAAGPARVVPVAHADEAGFALAHLSAGRWWPDVDDLLLGIEHVVPDQLVAEIAQSTTAGT
jgi:hypothetical protein